MNKRRYLWTRVKTVKSLALSVLPAADSAVKHPVCPALDVTAFAVAVTTIAQFKRHITDC
jgi:hypothetical protein